MLTVQVTQRVEIMHGVTGVVSEVDEPRGMALIKWGTRNINWFEISTLQPAPEPRHVARPRTPADQRVPPPQGVRREKIDGRRPFPPTGPDVGRWNHQKATG